MPAPAPFIVFSLPRSRSFWLATWLGTLPGPVPRLVSHDAAIGADRPDDWLDWVAGSTQGAVETGLVEAWPVIRKAIPGARFATLWRPLGEILQSLQGLGVDVEAFRPELEARHRALDALAGEPGTLVLWDQDLSNPMIAAKVQAWAYPEEPFNWDHWLACEGQELVIDWPARQNLLATRAEALGAAKVAWHSRIARPEPYLSLLFEPLISWFDDVQELGRAHTEEAKGDIEGPFALDASMMERMESLGLLWMMMARVDGVPVGYSMWTRQLSMESEAPPTVLMGPLYVAPGHEGRGLGQKLLRKCLRFFTSQGFVQAKLHHTAHGRGAKCGPLFQRLGAKPFQHEYVMTLEKGPPDD